MTTKEIKALLVQADPSTFYGVSISKKGEVYSLLSTRAPGMNKTPTQLAAKMQAVLPWAAVQASEMDGLLGGFRVDFTEG